MNSNFYHDILIYFFLVFVKQKIAHKGKYVLYFRKENILYLSYFENHNMNYGT